MTFDQLQRYRLASEMISLLREGKPLMILDAGSGEGFLRNFLPGDTILNLDRTSFSIRNFIQADILQLPFPAGRFQVVLALDVLEHVPSSRRRAFLDELSRVTEDFFIIGSPFRDEKVEEAEKLANDFCLQLTGRENEFLIEHLTEGLPRLEKVLEWMAENNYRSVVLPNAYLYRWLLMICLNAYLSSLAEPWNVIFAANDLYHQRFYSCDNTEPSYRKIILASKSGSPKLGEIEKKLRSAPPPDINLELVTGFMREVGGRMASVRGEAIERLKGRIRELEAKLDFEVKKLTGIIDEKSKEVRELNRWARQSQAELEEIKATAAYKIFQILSKKFRKK